MTQRKAEPGTAFPGSFPEDGVLAGTLIATPEGWRAVERLAPGDSVLSFDRGSVELREIRRQALPENLDFWPRAHWPLTVAAGQLGNREGLRLLPDQLLLIESDIAEDMFGDPFALLPARALVAWRGIAPARPLAGDRALQLVFSRDELIYAGSTLLLYFQGPVGTRALLEADTEADGYVPLSLGAARELVARIAAEEVGAALRLATPRGPQAAFG